MGKKTYSNPERNSVYAQIMRSKDKEKIRKFNEWRRKNLDDVASMVRWARDGCTSGQVGRDRTEITREDLSWDEDE
jgi:hypothetical protein